MEDERPDAADSREQPGRSTRQMQLGDTVVRLVPSMATILRLPSRMPTACGQTAKHETEGSASTKAFHAGIGESRRSKYQNRSPEISHE